ERGVSNRHARARLALAAREREARRQLERRPLEVVRLDQEVDRRLARALAPPLAAELELGLVRAEPDGRDAQPLEHGARARLEPDVAPRPERKDRVPGERQPVPVVEQVALHVLAVLEDDAERRRGLEEERAR